MAGREGCTLRSFGRAAGAGRNRSFVPGEIVASSQFSPVTPVTFLLTNTSATLKGRAKESEMAKNHYTTKPKRRNRSGKRKDTRRIAANMAKIRELERSPGRTE
jgi:hypothetical protein